MNSDWKRVMNHPEVLIEKDAAGPDDTPGDIVLRALDRIPKQESDWNELAMKTWV